MNILLQKRLSQIGCSLILVSGILGLLDPAAVRADVGPQPVLPGGSSLKPGEQTPGEQTPVQMAAELVTVRSLLVGRFIYQPFCVV